MRALDLIDGWPAATAAAAMVAPDGQILDRRGDPTRAFALASVTKLLTALATHLAAEEGSISLEDVVTPAGATVGDLLAHAGGLGPDGSQLSRPRARRIYSNRAYTLVAEHVASTTGFSFAEYLARGVTEPLGMRYTELVGDAGAGARSCLADLTRLIAALTQPDLISRESLDRLTTAYLPDLAGVLPGFGRQVPNPWGMGAEVRGNKAPHWTARSASTSTFGHFGQSGTFVWVDPVAGVGLVVLTDRPFGHWAVEAWPALSEAVLVELGVATEV